MGHLDYKSKHRIIFAVLNEAREKLFWNLKKVLFLSLHCRICRSRSRDRKDKKDKKKKRSRSNSRERDESKEAKKRRKEEEKERKREEKERRREEREKDKEEGEMLSGLVTNSLLCWLFFMIMDHC